MKSELDSPVPSGSNGHLTGAESEQRESIKLESQGSSSPPEPTQQQQHTPNAPTNGGAQNGANGQMPGQLAFGNLYIQSKCGGGNIVMIVAIG